MTFFGPSTAEQEALLKNTLHWLSQGVGGGDPHEPNDSPTECTPIFFDVPITDPTIAPPGDYDYYCFTGGGGQTIAADVDAWVNSSPLDPVLTLFDSDGTTILAENDDYNGLDSYLEHTLPHDGTFYLRVRDYGTPHGGPDYIYSILLTDVTQPRSLPWELRQWGRQQRQLDLPTHRDPAWNPDHTHLLAVVRDRTCVVAAERLL
jgi:hypothetical protein